MTNRVWVVRCSDFDADYVKDKKSVFIGWDINDLRNYKGKNETQTRERIKAALRESYHDKDYATDGWVNINAGQLYRFAFEIEDGDIVLTPIKGTDEILIGKIVGDYKYDSKEKWSHIREVKWIKRISRGDLSVPARNSGGAISTVFSMDEHSEEIKNIVEGKVISTPKEEITKEEKEDIAQFSNETEEKARGLIIDMLSKIDGYDFQKLVAAVLRACGYRTEESPRGRDKGVDILAYSDDIGLSRIKIQVKHRKGSMSGPQVRSFVGTLQKDDKGGLYISTGGFTEDGRNAAQGHPVRLINGEDFVDFLLKSYENLEPEYKAMIPLKKIYMPR
jgi:restriction system protein